ncbi:MAG: ATP-binding protein [Pirellulaceae bacterium]|nr:ATP-binding protein [Pirellulaceae bacterium]
MPEYGREYWDKHQVGRRLTMDQLVEIAKGHLVREDALVMQANKYLFIDTDASTTLQYSYYYHDAASEELVRLAHATTRRYDLFFLCEPDIPYDNTWDRSGEVLREQMHRRIEADLRARRIPFHRLTGDLSERLDRVNKILIMVM